MADEESATDGARRELVEAGAAVVAARAELKAIRAEEKALAARRVTAASVERAALDRRERAILAGLAEDMSPDDIAAKAAMSRTAVYDWIENNRRREMGRPKRKPER